MAHINLIPGEQGIRLSTLSPKYLHTNSTSHTWPFSAIAELIDNAYDPDVDASQLWIDIKRYGTRSDHCLTFTDNGAGMDSLKLHKMLSFGFCEKVAKNDHLPVGHYGNGFKSGSMRLGKDALVFTKQQDSKSVGLLSQTYLEEIKAQTILVPIVSWDSDDNMVKRADGDKALQDILKYSLFKSKKDLQDQFDNIQNQSGTRIIISNMRKNQDGKPEFDFRTDLYDIRIPDDVESDSNKYRRQERQNHIPESDYSLRKVEVGVKVGILEIVALDPIYKILESSGYGKAYCSILYLRPRMQIILRGKKVRTTVIAKSLSKTEVDTYKPQGVSKAIKVTFGFSQNRNHYGIMMYHRNRLIKPYVRVGYQLRANNLGVGVIGVIQCDYLQPTHNKQDFDYTKAYRSSMSSLGSKLNDYWNEKKGKTQANSNVVIPEPKEVESVPDQLWVQCDNPECLKWRKLPPSVKSDDLPEKWYCCDHPEKQWRSCDVPEELEDENEEVIQPYVKKQKKRLEKELEEKKRREKEATAVKELELEVRKKELQKKEAELQKLIKAVEAKSTKQKETLQQQKGTLKTEAQSPQKLQVRVVGSAMTRQQTTQAPQKYIVHQPNGQKVILTPVSSQSAQNVQAQVVRSNTMVTAVASPTKQVVKTVAAPSNTQTNQQPSLCIVNVVTHGSSVPTTTKPVLATASTVTKHGQIKIEPKVGVPTVTQLGGSQVLKVGGPPVMLRVNSQAAARHISNLPTMVPVSAIVDPTPKVVSVQSLATPTQNNTTLLHAAQPVEVKPQAQPSSEYRPLESLMEVNKHAAESSISPVSAVIPDNITPSMTSPTLGRKDVTINDKYRYIAPSGKGPITASDAGTGVMTNRQREVENPLQLDGTPTPVKTDSHQYTSSCLSPLKRSHNGVADAGEPQEKLQKDDSAVIIIDPPSPLKHEDTKPDMKPAGPDSTVVKTETNSTHMDNSSSQEHKPLPGMEKNLPNIDKSIVDAVREMSPPQQFKALLNRTQQLYDLRKNVCKLLRVLVPELEVDDRAQNYEDQTVDELLQQVLEQAETSDLEASTT